MENDLTLVAFIYDFDKTLCDKDMQEYSFIPALGMDSEHFWNKTTELINKEKMDKILGYMYMMLKEAKENELSINKNYLNSLGKDINFFPGVVTWFERVNEYGKKIGLKIEHYIVSSGLREIIKGTPISKYFKEIYACEFLYNEDGNAIWPKMSVNYTAKTQFISRINKGVLDISDDNNLNKAMLDENRRISTKNMIYFGDGLTDIPSMRMTRENGGYAIAVYQNNNKEIVNDLLLDDRIDFHSEANYNEDSELDKLIKNILIDISIKSKLNNIHKKQINEIKNT